MDSTDKTELYTPAEVDVDEKIAAMRAEIDAQKSINSSLSRLTSGMQAEIDTKTENWEQAGKDLLACRALREKEQAEIDELKNMIATLQFWYDLSDDHEDAVDALIAKYKQE